MFLHIHKTVFLTLAFLVFTTSISFAQSFQFFPNNARAVYFIDDPDNCFGGYCLKGYRVDSTSGNTQYSYREATIKNDLPGNCMIATNLAPWLGDRVNYTSNGFNLVINENGDTLRTFIHPSNGTSWTFFNLGNGEYIRATQETQYFKQYVGKHDDTKRIRLHRMNLAGDTLPSPWNGNMIEYSFNFSIYNFPNANNFPDDTSMYYIYGLNRIIPGSPASMDTLVPDADAFFEFFIGQEWHYQINQRYLNDTNEQVFVETKRKELLTDIEWNADSSVVTLTKLKVDVVWQENGMPPDEQTPFYTFTDTIVQQVQMSDYDYLNRMPDEFYADGPFGPGYVRWFAEGEWNGRIQKRFYEGWEFDATNHCLSPDPHVDGRIERIFVDKIGLVYEQIPGQNQSEDLIEKELVFYQRGLEEWGEAIDFQQYFEVISSIDENQNHPSVVVFPNPAQSQIFVNPVFVQEQIAGFRIFDMSGRTVLSGEINTNQKFSIDLTALTKGVYLLEVSSHSSVLARKRIIKF